MTITYMEIPQKQVLIGGTDVSDKTLTFDVVRLENGYDTATLILNNLPALYPTPAAPEVSAVVKVKDASDGAWTTLLNGIVRFPAYTFGTESKLVLKCYGAGYPTSKMNCAEEYGTQSRRSTLDTFKEILTDSTYGIIPKHINYVLGSSNASGHSITTDLGGGVSSIEDISGSIPYLPSPYKPVNKAIDDLCDIVTAIKAGAAGPHWIVDVNGVLRAKTIGGTQTGWTKYYGDSQANATLTADDCGLEGSFEPLGKEANYIIYYGQWRRPSSGEAWSEYATDGEAAAAWLNDAATTITSDGTYYIVGAKSVKGLSTTTDVNMSYPYALNAGWDFSSWTEFNTPYLNMYLRTHSRPLLGFYVKIYLERASDYWLAYADPTITADDTWYHIKIPIGPYWQHYINGNIGWSSLSTATAWTAIKNIKINTNAANIYVDGVHFGTAAICRVAREKYPGEGGTLGQSTNKVCMKIITDNVGKDDSLSASDDSFLLARLAAAELLRARSTATTGSFSTRMIKDVLPGQYWYIGEDWRITRLTQRLNGGGYTTDFDVTNDLTNSHARARYEDQNKLFAAMRPEYQDRQASSLKAGDLDIRVARLEKYYA